MFRLSQSKERRFWNTRAGVYRTVRSLIPFFSLPTSRDRQRIAELLLDAGARPSAGCLTAAARLGHIRLVQLLLARGAKVNLEDSAGATPLHEVRPHPSLSAGVRWRRDTPSGRRPRRATRACAAPCWRTGQTRH
jgi:hypothetical protein